MMSVEEFLVTCRDFNLIYLSEEIIGDTVTPVSVYQALCQDKDYSFLLESAVEGRYSFIGIAPRTIIKDMGQKLIIESKSNGKIKHKEVKEDLIKYLQSYMQKFVVKSQENLPPYSGGFVGYFSYELIDKWEDMHHEQSNKHIQKTNIPNSILVEPEVVIAFDHNNHTIKVINSVYVKKDLDIKQKRKLYYQHKKIIKNVVAKINRSKFDIEKKYNTFKEDYTNIKSNTTREEYMKMVQKAKSYIKNGDAFQIVLSQKFYVESDIPPFQVYRALRITNPSPYLFYLSFSEQKVIGSSPEVLVRVSGRKVITRPLAGTRPRGNNKKEDMLLERDLCSDQKEHAEHVMLVDLGRNDLGRVCKVGSVKVTEMMGVEYFSSVMHLVSQVEGSLKNNITALEALQSVFPAGTVSGAPKIKAMEIIDFLEKDARGVYAGAVGYIDYSGDLDTCITIRTFYIQDKKLYAQVGAGIVYDSIPEKEYEETLNKGKALFNALKIIRKDGSYDLNYR